ncbi:13305_t:CDS:2 [Ambispora gerdemannii]|uniref:13305_t:CDS:1 n=1 Tax=Ambispora gerdemannii TaxID=144530 RepID=A0A9N8WA11_9GLOM|nr:13305_t:CDS:2 [Ambispora gerdemannii]
MTFYDDGCDCGNNNCQCDSSATCNCAKEATQNSCKCGEGCTCIAKSGECHCDSK